ncbi:M23 family metallopeptidase [Bartonella raoultii]|uniref:Peptidoglycan DD-metalloendopeptidase family protein n=1 Tax=Bartonella raoultii TaxID=1457020 RepID=A0ABS7ICD4_9HYPH|nr:M23 family metallopeptidase [Bartonella raoultii]MBX4336200.1 peptidoglycan DD-metalloendopeptidase family protein [Bartonella raoultii]
MCLKVLGIIFQRYREIAFLAIIAILSGCSSSTQRFTNTFSTQSAVSTTMPVASSMLSYGGMIQSTELPPVESSNDSENYNSASYNSQSRILSPDGRTMGAPPRNLGTLSRSQVNNSPIFQKNSYIVQSGDTLLSIARQVGVSVDALKSVNGIKNNFIYIGQVLMLPSKSTVSHSNTRHNGWITPTKKSSLQSQTVDSIKHQKNRPFYKAPAISTPSTKIHRSDVGQSTATQRPSSSYETDISDTMMNGLPPQASGISKMRWPVKGRLLSQFGQKKGMTINRGIDIFAPEGSLVKAAENGVVIYASDGLKELGNVVMIRHENGIITIYGYNSQLFVHRGQRVRRGAEIAKSGMSGDVKTPRVYFEVRKNSLPVDPLKYLEN